MQAVTIEREWGRGAFLEIPGGGGGGGGGLVWHPRPVPWGWGISRSLVHSQNDPQQKPIQVGTGSMRWDGAPPMEGGLDTAIPRTICL